MIKVEFAGDCILSWWKNYGQSNYPNATSLLFLCDCGVRSNVRYYIFKEQLQKLSAQIGLEIRIAKLTTLYLKIQSN
jgi:hypothetical protein